MAIAVLTLPQGSTIRSIAGNLTDEYVRAVLENVKDCERQMGDALVAISLMDGRIPPSYRIDAVMDLETGETMNWQNFSGRTHRPLSEKQERQVVWSSAWMTWRQLSELRGEIRNFQKRPSNGS
jgi:hypothetical protein